MLSDKNGRSHGADNQRTFWCNPGMLPFLQSRDSGGKVAERQLNRETVSSGMAILTPQLKGF